MPAPNKKVAGAIVAALAICTPLVAGWEGTRNDPYFDLRGIATVCTGETRVAMRHYSDAECKVMLDRALAGFAGGVLDRNPNLAGRPYQLAAATSLSYNIGSAAYARSTVARRFSEGRFREGCDAFLQWRFAGGREIRGLLNRRKAERTVCLRGVA